MKENKNIVDYSIISLLNSLIANTHDIEKIINEINIILTTKFDAEDSYLFLNKNEKLYSYKRSSKKSENIENKIKELLKSNIDKITLFENFLLYIPLIFGNINIGGIILHLKSPIELNNSHLEFFNALSNYISSILLTMIQNVSFKSDNEINKTKKVKFIKGLGISPGIGIGKAYIKSNKVFISSYVLQKRTKNPQQDYYKLLAILDHTLKILKDIEHSVRNKLGNDIADIFLFHQSILKDPNFLEYIKTSILNEHKTPEFVIVSYFDELKTKFESINPHILSDLEDIKIQILNELFEDSNKKFNLPKEDFIYICEELVPSDIIKIHSKNLKGIIEKKGGLTSHAAILAKSLNIPLIVNIQDISYFNPNDFIILDSTSGMVYINPDETIIEEYKNLITETKKRLSILIKSIPKETYTKDNIKIDVGANIGILSELEFVSKYKVEYVGLYRTEFPFIVRYQPPTENEQFEIYKKAIEKAKVPITFRILDIGGDKAPSYIKFSKEENPVLGKRSIRLLLDIPEYIKTQLRALYRASQYGPINIMFPMISSIEELRQILSILSDVRTQLSEKGIKFNHNIKIGSMIEVPSAVWIIDKIFKYVDFVSIGTNDLIQYTLAVDRNNNSVLNLFKPLHPAILRSIKRVVLEGEKVNKPVYICGEMASNPLYASILIGLGVKHLSMNVHSIPSIKNTIKNIEYNQVKKIARKILNMETAAEIEDYIIKNLGGILK